MTRVFFVGQQPETVDFTNPMLPPGMNAEDGQPLEDVPDHLARPVMEAICAGASHGEIFLPAIKRVLDNEEPEYRS
jgi:hypothetical protein